jgi:transposase
MWKKSIGVRVVKHIKIQADKGYQGIAKLLPNSETPKKKTKKQPLTKEDKANNHRINSQRVKVEHTNCRLKRFHIVADTYRNRRKRFGLRVTLLCGLHNFELAFS